jgi:single-stranded DNA-binding protein
MSGVIRVTIAQATVADFRRIETRTGRPMVRFRAEIGKDRLSVVAFNNLAEHLDLADGDTVNVTGRLQGTSWEGQDGGRRYGWQVIAEQVEQAGQDRHTAPPTSSTSSAPPTSSTRPTSPTRPATGKRQDRQVRMFNSADPGPFDYGGGPF